MPQLATVQQHHTRGILSRRTFTSHFFATQDGFATHIPPEEFEDIGYCEYVRVDDYGSAFVIHELWRQKA